MISKEFRFIFIAIPKTGTTTIESILERYESFKHIHPANKKHLTLSEIEEYKFLTDEQIETYFKFSYVRNPWDRIVSLYHRKEGIQFQNKLSFEEFVKWNEFSSDTCVWVKKKLRNQLDWLKKGGSIKMDFIGRFENLQNDFDTICDRLSISKYELPCLNKTVHKPYWEYYNNETGKIVAERFREDIEYFGYEFGS